MRYQAERRNRIWQAGFTRVETTAEGAWRLCPVVNYATKAALTFPITPTQGAIDLLGALQGAVEAAEALLGRRLVEDCTDPATGGIAPPGSRHRQRPGHEAGRSHPAHVRTRHRSPHTNGVVERWTEPLKYERLYRYDIASGVELADHAAAFIDEYNAIRPHQHLDQKPPLTAYLDDRALNSNPPRNEQKNLTQDNRTGKARTVMKATSATSTKSAGVSRGSGGRNRCRYTYTPSSPKKNNARITSTRRLVTGPSPQANSPPTQYTRIPVPPQS